MFRRALHRLTAASSRAAAASARAEAASAPRATFSTASLVGRPLGAVAAGRPPLASPLPAPLGATGLAHPTSLHPRRGIFIQTQTTPNPASLMFLPGRPVYEDGPSANFATAREAMASPLARRLFAIDGVVNVFFGSEFVTVTKNDDHEWGVLKPEVFAAVMDFYASGDPVMTDGADLAAAGTAIDEDDDEIVAMIKELLETRIRPAVAEDGGDIVFRGWDEKTGVVTVKMQGACDGCPSSSVTLKSGIENMLRHYVPEVQSVEQEAEEGGMDLLDMATMNR